MEEWISNEQSKKDNLDGYKDNCSAVASTPIPFYLLTHLKPECTFHYKQQMWSTKHLSFVPRVCYASNPSYPASSDRGQRYPGCISLGWRLFFFRLSRPQVLRVDIMVEQTVMKMDSTPMREPKLCKVLYGSENDLELSRRRQLLATVVHFWLRSSSSLHLIFHSMGLNTTQE